MYIRIIYIYKTWLYPLAEKGIDGVRSFEELGGFSLIFTFFFFFFHRTSILLITNLIIERFNNQDRERSRVSWKKKKIASNEQGCLNAEHKKKNG